MAVDESIRTSITALLSDLKTGEEPVIDHWIPHIYEELREMAHRQLAGEHGARTLQTTALVHEAYMRLVDDTQVSKRGRAYFFASASRTMRRVLVDQARKRNADKRGAGVSPVSLDEAQIAIDDFASNLLDLDQALEELSALSPRQAQVIECRFFGGLGVKETANALNISERTARNDWTIARAWLHRRLKTTDA
ncbi:unnamed protein product [Laminaria digitata]